MKLIEILVTLQAITLIFVALTNMGQNEVIATLRDRVSCLEHELVYAGEIGNMGYCE